MYEDWNLKIYNEKYISYSPICHFLHMLKRYAVSKADS